MSMTQAEGVRLPQDEFVGVLYVPWGTLGLGSIQPLKYLQQGSTLSNGERKRNVLLLRVRGSKFTVPGSRFQVPGSRVRN